MHEAGLVDKQEFEHNAPHLPRPRRWNEDEGRRFTDFPEDNGRFRRPPRDEPEFGVHRDEQFFREREFGRSHDFDHDGRFPGDRRPPPECEHGDPFHPAYRFLLCLIVCPS